MRGLVCLIVAGCSTAQPKAAATTAPTAPAASATTTTVEPEPNDGAQHEHVPRVAISEPTVGAPDKAIIRRYIKRVTKQLQACYDKQVLVDPKLAGTVTVAFTIAPDGSVSAATGSGLDPTVDRCVADVIRQIQFPQPRGGGSMQVSYPFVFRP